MGASADYLGPGPALVVGGLAGVISVFGYVYVTPHLCRKFGIEDTCGVHNLHGVPALLGAITSAIAIAVSS